jgi:hypothetical protein
VAYRAHSSNQIMESSTLFDLNETIRRWRERLISLRAFGADDLEELENHLRESVAELQAGGLSLEEAFRVATERLGSDQRLAEEYAKTNVRRIWTARALWMLGGVIAWLGVKALVETGLGIVFNGGLWLGLDARLVVVVDFLTQWTVTVACIGLACWLVVRRKRWVVGTVSQCFRHPVLTGLALVLGLMGLQILSRLEALWWYHGPNPVAALPAAGQDILRTWGFSGMLLHRLICVAAIPLLAVSLWKRSRTMASPVPAPSIASLQPSERALTAGWEAQGLSRSESHLVIGLRRGYRAAPTEAQAQLASGLWLERGFWMTVGMVTYWMLRDFVEMPSWALVHSGSSSPPLWQHFGGLLALCLPFALAGTALAVFWKRVTGLQQRRRLFEQSPVRGAVFFATLALLWVGVTAYLHLIHPVDAPLRYLPFSLIEMIWGGLRFWLTELLLPVILLVWVGHRQQTGRKLA